MISRRDAIALCVLLTILPAAPAVAGSLPSCGPWERIASPTADVQWGMTHGDGLFVSVGENGSILTSPDGFAWSERDGLGELLFDVVWNPSGEEYLAVGSQGAVLASSDGIDWTARSFPTTSAIRAVTWDDGLGLYVAVAATSTGSGEIWTSGSGSSWTLQQTTGTSADAFDISDSGGLVAAGDNGAIWTSGNGVDWTMTSVPGGQDLEGIAFGDGTYVVVGFGTSVFTSSDGSSWSEHPDAVGGTLSQVAWSGDRFVAVGEQGRIETSPDGVVWTLRSFSRDHLEGVAWSGSAAVAAGRDGVLWRSECASPTADFSRSPRHPVADEPVAFADRSRAVPSSWSWLFGDGKADSVENPLHAYAAPGTYGVSLTATNGSGSDSTTRPVTVSSTVLDCQPWEAASSPTTLGLEGVTHGAGQFVAVGHSGAILTSPDGETWSEQSGTVEFLAGVAWDGTEYVAVGNPGVVLTSPDGVTWTTRSFPTTDALKALAWSGLRWAEVGSGPSATGQVHTSRDARLWAFRDSQTFPEGNANDVVWADPAGFVAVGKNGVLLTSPEGAVWTTGQVASTTLNGVAWDGTTFVAVGEGTSVFTSSGGASWSEHVGAVGGTLNGVAFAGDRFVGVGNDGRIETSADGVAWSDESPGGSHLRDAAWSGTRAVAVGDAGTIWLSRCAGDGALDLDLTGTCPGEISLDLTGATPDGTVALISGTGPGSTIVPGGSCEGTELGLERPNLLSAVPADADGEIHLMRSVPEAACGLVLQALDLATCATSDVASFP